MIVNKDYRSSLAAREASLHERRRLRQRAMLVLGMVVLGLSFSGLVKIYHWVKVNLETPHEKVAAVVLEEPPPVSLVQPDVRPKYDFYEVLPRRRLEITEEEIVERPLNLPPGMLEDLTARNTQNTPPSLEAATDDLTDSVGQGTGETPKGYLIQAGAFGDPLKADQMRARIAALGFAARVELVERGGSTLNRVRLGPFTDPQEVEAMRIRLGSEGIDIDIINRY